jgi:lysozyme
VNAARILLITSSVALLVLADFLRRQEQDGDGEGSAPDWSDEARGLAAEAVNAMSPTEVSGMSPSGQLQAMLRRGEAVRLTRYRLGDGGWTIGIGRYYKDGGELPPETITREQADAWFAEDIEARGARWVRAYVSVELNQAQFDALTSMAFNLKPSSFKTIADAVNRGEDPEATSLNFVREGTDLEAGLRNRRAREIQLYRTGVYS